MSVPSFLHFYFPFSIFHFSFFIFHFSFFIFHFYYPRRPKSQIENDKWKMENGK